MQINYDKKYDIIHIQIGKMGNQVAVEEDEGIVIFRDRETRDITSVKIFDIKKKLKEA